MYKNKKVLLIAGGGTLGEYVSEELLRLGASVEVICPKTKEILGYGRATGYSTEI